MRIMTIRNKFGHQFSLVLEDKAPHKMSTCAICRTVVLSSDELEHVHGGNKAKAFIVAALRQRDGRQYPD